MKTEGPTVVPSRLACVVLVIALSLTPSSAFDLGTASALPDPGQQVRAGLPLVPDPGGDVSKGTQGVFPFEPIDRDPTDGLRHGWVQTSNGRFGLRATDLTLPARVPFRVGRVYDSGVWARLPLVPVGDEPRPAWDLGPNWSLAPSSVLMVGTGGTFLLVTDEAGLVTYVAAGGGKYKPSPDRPFRFGMMEPGGTNIFKVRLTDGLLRTYTKLSGQLNYWLTKEEDPSGNALNFVYVGGMLQRINASDGAWVEFKRPVWGASAPSWVRNTRVVQIVDSAGRSLGFEYNDRSELVAFTDAAGGRWTYTYDSDHHVVDLFDALGQPVIHTVTDAQSRATEVQVGGATTAYVYETAKTRVTVANAYEWVYEFDTRGMTTKTTAPDGGITLFARDATTGDLTQVTDAAGGVHDFGHDTNHRTTLYRGPSIDGVRSEWRFERDAAGRLSKITPPAGGVQTFVRNAQGWITGAGADRDADGTAEAITSYERASNGDVLAVADPAGYRTEYVYSAPGQVIAIKPKPCLAAGSICPEIQYEHDAAGRTTKFRWPRGTATWSEWVVTYKATGQVLTLQDPMQRTWTLAVDANGRISSVTAPDGGRTEYSWRPDGQLS